jgi:hypothetical protein
MAWQKTKPLSTDQLKNSQADIANNFTAIEAGDVPYDYIRLEDQASAPATVASHGLLYTLTSDSDLYFKDGSGNVTLLSTGGASIIPRAYGKIASATGYVVSSTSFNIDTSGPGTETVRVDTGVYRVYFSSAMPRADYVVNVTTAMGSSARVASIGTSTQTTVKSGDGTQAPTVNYFYVNVASAVSGAARDADFHFTVYSAD